jgi:hypothetical protein
MVGESLHRLRRYNFKASQRKCSPAAIMSKQPTKNPAAVALGRLGGKAGTEAQNAARRLNGKKGGRKRKK